MKLHLPKGLRRAVLACMTALASFSTTVGTGVMTGGVAMYMFAGAQAQAGWGADRNTNGYIYWYSDSSTEVVAPTADNGVAVQNPGYASKADKYENLFLCSESQNNSQTLTKLSAGNGVSFTVTANPWDGNKLFNGMVIESLVFADGQGAGSFNLAQTTATVTVKTVDGTLSRVSNSGTLTLGEAGKTIDVSGTITNTGTMTILGTINVTDTSGLNRRVVGYTDGTNGYAIYEGYSIFDGSNIDTSAATITYNGSTMENTWIDGAREYSEAYYLTNTGTSTFEAQNGDSLKLSSIGGTLIVDGEAGTKVTLESLELSGASKTTLQAAEGVELSGTTNRFVINTAGQELVVGSGVHLTYTGVGPVENSPVPAENYALSIGNGTLTIAGGHVSAESFIMQDGGGTTSYVNITDGGLLEIIGKVDSDWKKGSARLAHWGGTSSMLTVSNGEFRSENATVCMGDDGQGNLLVTDSGEANLKGIVRLNSGSQLQVKNGGKLNIGVGGITGNENGVINVDAAVIGALSAEGWSSSLTTNIGNGSTIQLAVYDIATGSYQGSADITLSGALNGTGALTLAGAGRLTISSMMQHQVGLAEGSTAELAITGLTTCDVVGVSGYTGYGDSTTDGYGATLSYRIAGAGSTLDSVTLVQGDTEENYEMTDGVIAVQGDINIDFYVNKEVYRSGIDKVREGTRFTINANGIYHTDTVGDLAVTTATDKSATIYLQNADGKDVIKLSNLPATQVAGFTVNGNSVVADAGNYSADVTVLNGTVLSQAQTDGNDKVGIDYSQNTERTITVQGGATFDISGKEAYYHVVLEKGAVLTNTGASVGKSSRNLPVVDLNGDATIEATNRLGMVGDRYDTVHLNLNGNTLTKTGEAVVHFTNCAFDKGTVRIENGFIELIGKDNKKADYSAVTFEICADEEAGTSGGLDYMGRSSDVLGHVVGKGGSLLVGTGYTANIDKLSGSAIAKIGLGSMVMGSGASIESDMKIAALAGNLTLEGGVAIKGDVNITSNRNTLTLGALNIAEGKTLAVTGSAFADGLSNTGTGMLTIDALSGIISYSSAADKMQITSLSGETIIDLIGIADQLSDGVELGIAYSEDNLKNIVVSAVEEGTYELVDSNGYIKLQAKGDATLSVSTDWDINWGAEGLVGEPDSLQFVTSSENIIGNAGYKKDGVVAISLADNGKTSSDVVRGDCDNPRGVFGGAYDAPWGAGTTEIAKVWIDAKAGAYGVIVGGNMCGNWNGSSTSSFAGDTHILIKDDSSDTAALYTGLVVGANYGDGEKALPDGGAIFKGDTYLSVYSDSVGGGIYGGSVNYHGGPTGKSFFTGDTHVFVYVPLSDDGSAYRGEGDAVVGGAFCAGGTHYFSGDAELTVDLTDYSGTATAFDKAVVGGGVVNGFNSTTKLNMTDGTATLTIKGTNAASQAITFNDVVVGGAYIKNDKNQAGAAEMNASVVNITGGNFSKAVVGGSYLMIGTVNQQSSTLNITGGKYSADVIGGMCVYQNASSSSIGKTALNISGGTFNNVYGGTFLDNGTVAVSNGKTTVTISGEDTKITGNLVGGMLIGGGGDTAMGNAELGDVTLTISGGTVNNVCGGSNVWRNTADATVTQGAIAINISNATVSGDIYAAGTQNNSTKLNTVSTEIILGDDAVLTVGKTVSGGYGGGGTGSVITGDKVLKIAATESVDYTGIRFIDFNKMGVANSGVTATIGGAAMTVNDALTVVEGKGTLKLAAGTALTLNNGATIDGTVDLNGQSVAGDVTVGKGTLMAGGASVNGNLTLAAGSTLTLWDGADAATNGVLDMSGAEDNVLTIGGLFNLNVGLNVSELAEVTLITGIDAANLDITGFEFDADNKAQAAGLVLNGTQITAEQNLWLVQDGDALKLSTMAGLNDFYWDGGNGEWTDASWTMEDGGSVAVNIEDASTRNAEVNAIFNQDETATINVSAAASVDNMTFEKGAYTFTGESLSVEGQLETMAGASATFSSATEVGSLANAGSLEVEGALTVTGDAGISGGSVEADSITVGGAYTQTAGDVLTSELAVTGDVVISGGSIGSNATEALELSGITIGNAGVSNVELAGSTITGTLTNSSTLGLSGTIELGSGITVENQHDDYSAGENGYKTSSGDYIVVTGGTTTATDVTWVVAGAEVAADKAVFNNGTLTVSGAQGTVYFVRDGEVSGADISSAATGILLADKGNGTAELVLTTLPSVGISVEGTGNTINLDSQTLVLGVNSLTLVDGATVSLDGKGVYDLGAGTAMPDGVSLDSDWQGTVLTAGALFNTTDLSGLCLAGSTLELNGGLSYTDTLDTLNVAGGLTLGDNFSLDLDDDLLASVADGTTLTLIQTGTGIIGSIGNVATAGFTQSADGTMWQTENKNGYCYTITIDGNNITLSSQLAGIGWTSTDGVWTGEDGADWKGGSEPGAEQDIALFAGNGTSEVRISGTVKPHGITITPAEDAATTDYSFVGEGEGAAIKSTDALNVLSGSASFDNLTATFENSSKVADGAELNIGNGDAADGVAKVTMAELNNAGTTSIGADGTLTVEGAVTNTGTLSSKGNMQLGSLNNEGSLSSTGETLDVTGDVANSGQMQLGGDVSFGSLTMVDGSELELAEDGSLLVEGAVDNAGTMAAEGDVKLGDVTNSGEMQLGGESSELASLDNSGTLEIQGGELIISGAAINSGDMQLDSESAELGSLDNSGTFELLGGELVISGAATNSGDMSLSGMVETENMVNNGSISLDADGMLVVDTLSGTGTTTLDGGSLALNSGADLSKLVLNSGTLVAEGALSNGDLDVIGEELSITGTEYKDTTGLDVYGELNLKQSGKIAGLSVYDNGTASFGAQPVATFRAVSGQPSYATFVAGTEGLTMESVTDASGITTVTITPTTGAKAAFNASNAIVKLGTTALTQPMELGGASTMAGGTLEFTLNLDAIGAQVFSGESLTLSGTEVILNEGSGSITNPGTGTVTLAGLNGTADSSGTVVLQGATLNKYYANARIEDGNIVAERNASYVSSQVKTTTANGAAGALLLDDALVTIDPQNNAATTPDLAALLNAVEKGAVTDEMAAAVAGSSTATLGMALASDVDRQLRAIRNRTTTMGVNQTIVNEGLPYVNAWVNAEGNHGELDSDGTAAGYTMDSWGGTIGFDVDVNTHLTVGMALTAMYGDLTADGPDTAEGDMDTLYLSAFARYAARATTHTFVATLGRMDGSLERTVNYGSGSYKTTGDMDGMALGLMYEYGRVYKLTEDGDACWQPIVNVAWRSTFVSGYNESGSDAALRVDDQTMHTLTIGAGARMQAIVGENLYNRTSILELRALAKMDMGNTKSEVDVALLKGGKCAGIESAELGMFGIELGAGLSVPVGNVDNGTLFFDASAEIRDGYTNFNGTVGYRINF